MTTPEPPVPPEAVTLAAVALHDAECPDRTCGGPALGVYYDRAGRALRAAMPTIRADECARIAAGVTVMRDNARSLCTSMPDEMAIGFAAQDEALSAVLNLIGEQP